MCGIAGIVNFNGKPVVQKELTNLMAGIKHRGPDDEGVYVKGGVGLGFVRLSIQDLSILGHQPMYSEDENFVIIFNGEVYNFIEIREELKAKYNFRSQTDTEVVLYSYIEWGEECLNRFNGMFSFVIYDVLKKKIFGARDRFGIKPFYYFKDDETFIFCSEIPPLLSSMEKQIGPNESVILNYLLCNRTNYSEETFFDDIYKIKPGHKFTIDKNILTIKKWYDVEKEMVFHSGFIDEKEYYQSLKRSVELQLRSDVPVGTCLSGGVDSSAITGIMINEFNHENLHSYSAIYGEGKSGDESEFIKLFDSSSLNMHFTYPTSKELLNSIDEYVYCLGEPVPSTSEFAEFQVMKLAKEHSTVLLNGQGADEVLGGYDYFYGAYLKEFLLRLKFTAFLKECFYLVMHRKLIKNLNYLVFFLAPSRLKCYLFRSRENILNKKFYLKRIKSAELLMDQFYKFNSLKGFFINHLKCKFEHHLAWADKSGMHFSLETRFPFIDHFLIEKTLATKNSMLLNKGWTKKILRDAVAGIVDNKILKRKDKVGFETPEGEWIKEPSFKKYILSILDSESFNSRAYFDAAKVKKKYNDHLNGKGNYANIIWKVIHLELWLRMFIDSPAKKAN